MSELPAVSDVIDMPVMGADVHIEVSEILDTQPLLAAGIVAIIDQYNEIHLVEMDGGSWITTNPDLLTPEQYDVYCNNILSHAE